MRLRLAALLTLAVLAAAPEAASPDLAHRFLGTAFGLTGAEIRRLDAGEVLSRTLAATDRREVATLGIVRIQTSPSTYVDRLTDIATFKRTGGVLQVGAFGTQPQPADIAPLTIDEADLGKIRKCRVEECEVRLPAEAIERARHTIDWHASDASSKASALVRQLLVEYVARYRQFGTAATMDYADRAPRMNVGREFASLLNADPITANYAPQLRRHLVDYPAASAATTKDFVYWSKELVRSRQVISVTHVAIAASGEDAPVAYAIGSKQIYAMHYYDASLGLTLLVPDRSASSPATYVVYLNRSRIDVFERLFGGVARRIVAGRARTLVAEQLKRLQGVLTSSPAAGQTTAESGFGRS
jgi:hypothetical protein